MTAAAGSTSESTPEPMQRFLAMLELERIDRDLFRAWNPPAPAKRPQRTLFGGQVAAHALRAAAATIDAPHYPHSLHGYFLRPGKDDAPTILKVDRIRDGRSFSTRTVVALQEGEAIFSLTASFHQDEPGGEFATPIALDAPHPEQLLDGASSRSLIWGEESPFDRVEVPEFSHEHMSERPRRAMWVRFRAPIPDDPILHACVLTYISDMGVVGAVRAALGRLHDWGMGASLDHSLWFHRRVRADDWLLFDVSSMSNAGSRGLGVGTMHTLDGVHALTIGQEALVRVPTRVLRKRYVVKIGLAGVGSNPDAVVRQAEAAEADGFTTLWYASPVLGDPLAAMALVAKATSTIELGTSVLQTYGCHPLLQAQRTAALAAVLGVPNRLTVGVGPSHQVVIEGALGQSYATPGRHTEEYVQILAGLLGGEQVSFSGAEFSATAGPLALPDDVAVPVLVGALGPRLLRVAGTYAAGTVTWMANATAIASHVAPTIRAAAADAGRGDPRIVVGLPVAVHDDVAEARAAATEQFGFYGMLPNYQRILAHGGVAGPAEAAIIGDEASVTDQLIALVEAGATDVWAAPFVVGDDRAASRSRTRALLKSLLG